LNRRARRAARAWHGSTEAGEGLSPRLRQCFAFASSAYTVTAPPVAEPMIIVLDEEPIRLLTMTLDDGITWLRERFPGLVGAAQEAAAMRGSFAADAVLVCLGQGGRAAVGPFRTCIGPRVNSRGGLS
jgi:hypothetical protein